MKPYKNLLLKTIVIPSIIIQLAVQDDAKAMSDWVCAGSQGHSVELAHLLDTAGMVC